MAISQKKKTSAKKTKMPGQKRLRDIAWEVGRSGSGYYTKDYISLFMIRPHRGHIYWDIAEGSLKALRKQIGRLSDSVSLIVRVYDVTDIIFDGLNAHESFDVHAHGHSGNYYFDVHLAARDLIAEIGLRCGDGSFHYLARSHPVFFERDRPSGNYQTAALFVGSPFRKTISVENIFDAPLYEKMIRELRGIERTDTLSVAQVFLDTHQRPGPGDDLHSFLNNISGPFSKFGGETRLFSTTLKDTKRPSVRTHADRISRASQRLFKQLSDTNGKRPFHIVHCHDWSSAVVGVTAVEQLQLPMVLSLHSTGPEPAVRNAAGKRDTSIFTLAKKAVKIASLVMVAGETFRQQLIDLYDLHPDAVVIVPHGFDERPSDSPPDQSEVRRWFGLNHDTPIVLFTGEISHASGADIMLEALPTVCRNHSRAQFVFAGDGPLKNELEARASHMGIGHRCRFLGDISRETFDALLMASDFVVIPARTWQDEATARAAIAVGRPVLTTHQAGIACVNHGTNGLVTFDNPGSIVWGIQEMLANPLQGSMLRIVAKKSAGASPSTETIAVQFYMHYARVLKNMRGKEDA